MRRPGQLRFRPAIILGLILVMAAGAAGQGRINWQSNLEATPQGFRLGIRDKNGDMAKNYRVFFQVVTPEEREYTIYRQVPAHHDEFVEVEFPRDFKAPAGAPLPGPYFCTLVVDMVPTIWEKFSYSLSGGRGVIQHRQTRFGPSGHWQ